MDLAASKATKNSATPKSSEQNARNVKFAPIESDHQEEEKVVPPTEPVKSRVASPPEPVREKVMTQPKPAKYVP